MWGIAFSSHKPPRFHTILLHFPFNRSNAMGINNDIEPLAVPVRPGNARTLSELEKATASHVEHSGKGAAALNDAALMAGERAEKVRT